MGSLSSAFVSPESLKFLLMTAGEEQHSSHTLILLLDTRGHAEANSLDGRVSTVPQTGRGGLHAVSFSFFFFLCQETSKKFPLLTATLGLIQLLGESLSYYH